MKETNIIKTTKTLLTLLGAAAVMNMAAFAGDLKLELVSNGHGQITPMYRSSESTVAIYTGGRGVGNAATSSNGDLKALSKDNGHGQIITQYWAK